MTICQYQVPLHSSEVDPLPGSRVPIHQTKKKHEKPHITERPLQVVTIPATHGDDPCSCSGSRDTNMLLK